MEHALATTDPAALVEASVRQGRARGNVRRAKLPLIQLGCGRSRVGYTGQPGNQHNP